MTNESEGKGKPGPIPPDETPSSSDAEGKAEALEKKYRAQAEALDALRQRNEAAERAYWSTIPSLVPPGAGTESSTTAAPSPQTGAAGDGTGGKGLSKEALALATLRDHPDWTDQQIADTVKCNRTSLYEMPDFVKAKQILKQGKKHFPKGRKDPDGNVEAWRDEDKEE
jgi:hypothetical protein